jgi:ribonuclease VapC
VILDSSALVAAVWREPGHEELEEKMRSAAVLAIGAPTLVETEIVVMRANGRSARGLVSSLREQLDVQVIPFGEAHAEAAAQAFQRFGKGRHPASLNYGDCMTYATAHLAEWPLLFKGNDFARTDIERA